MGGTGRSLAESVQNIEDFGDARARSPAKRMAELQGVPHFAPAEPRKWTRAEHKSYLDVMRSFEATNAAAGAKNKKNAQKTQNYTNSIATPKRGASGASEKPKKTAKKERTDENSGLTEQQKRMSLSQLLGGEDSGAQAQTA